MKTYVQQIMLGSVTSKEAEARETLRRIKEAGYDGLELNSFMIHPTGMLVRLMTRAAGMPTGKGGSLDWKALLAESGLSVASLHSDLGSLERDAASVAAEAKSFGTDKVVITGMYRFDYGNADEVRKLAERLNRAGEALMAGGISLLYHNHNIELLHTAGAAGEAGTLSSTGCVRQEDGRRAYDILIDETDKEYVNFEFDSYWFTDGGADAKAWMRRLGKRMKLWHINDRGSRQAGAAMTPILKCDSMELGTGNMDLDGLWAAAEENGVESVILESHKNWIGKDPVKSLELSAAWLKKKQ